MDTPRPDRKPGAVHRIWRAAAMPLLPLGLGLWVAGIVGNTYVLIVAGTLTLALGAYKLTDR